MRPRFLQRADYQTWLVAELGLFGVLAGGCAALAASGALDAAYELPELRLVHRRPGHRPLLDRADPRWARDRHDRSVGGNRVAPARRRAHRRSPVRLRSNEATALAADRPRRLHGDAVRL